MMARMLSPLRSEGVEGLREGRRGLRRSVRRGGARSQRRQPECAGPSESEGVTMLSGVSTIYFSTDLVYPPLPNFDIKKNQVRDLYNKLSEPGGYPYENLDLQA